MADQHVNECYSKSGSILQPNWSEAENLFQEKKRTNRNDALPSKCKLQLHWSGDFASLSHFVCNVIKLHGSWSQPGGDKNFLAVIYSVLHGGKTKNVEYIDAVVLQRIVRRSELHTSWLQRRTGQPV